jgi:hypothetical protein
VAEYVEVVGKNQVERYGRNLVLVDVVRAGPITPEARRHIVAERRRHMPVGAVAIVGANFAARTLAMMVFKATAYFAKEPQSNAFFASEVEGRAWLDKQRIRLDEERRGAANSSIGVDSADEGSTIG